MSLATVVVVKNTKNAVMTLVRGADSDSISLASRLLKEGELVALPTETVYGLAANAYNPNAIQAIYRVKGRPSDNPLILHISQNSWLADIATNIPKKAEQLIEAFWPGALTIVLKKADHCQYKTDLDTVAIRFPQNEVMQAVIEKAGVPLAAPSANISGSPSPTTARHVNNDLKGKIALIIDGGACQIGLESSVVDFTGDEPVLLRPGGVTLEQIEGIIGEIKVANPDTLHPISPGMKYKHYAPKAKLSIVEGPNAKAKIKKLLDTHKNSAVLASRMDLAYFVPYTSIDLGDGLDEISSRLFASLRQLDDMRVDYAFVEAFPLYGLGLAIMNRLKKAAENRVIV